MRKAPLMHWERERRDFGLIGRFKIARLCIHDQVVGKFLYRNFQVCSSICGKITKIYRNHDFSQIWTDILLPTEKQNWTLVIPFILNFIQPIFFANSNFAPTSHKTQRRTPQTIMERMYVGNCGSKRLPDRSTDMLFGVICKENKVGSDQHIGPVYDICRLPTPRLNFFELYARAKRPITFPFHFHQLRPWTALFKPKCSL